MLGKEAAMACTVAVEEVIGDHYDRLVDNQCIQRHSQSDSQRHK